jgi:hypothetical protein
MFAANNHQYLKETMFENIPNTFKMFHDSVFLFTMKVGWGANHFQQQSNHVGLAVQPTRAKIELK